MALQGSGHWFTRHCSSTETQAVSYSNLHPLKGAFEGHSLHTAAQNTLLIHHKDKRPPKCTLLLVDVKCASRAHYTIQNPRMLCVLLPLLTKHCHLLATTIKCNYLNFMFCSICKQAHQPIVILPTQQSSEKTPFPSKILQRLKL